MITLKDVWGNNLFESSSMDKKGALEQAVAEGADLTCVYYSSPPYYNVTLNFSKLKRANMPGGKFNYARLLNSDLREANLLGADLAGANLAFATLRGADLRNVDLTRSILKFTDLRGVKFNDQTKISKANFFENVLMDDDLKEFIIAQKI